MFVFFIYSLLYWIIHVYMVLKIKNKFFSSKIIVYRIILYLYDLLIIYLVTINNDLKAVNTFPIILSFAILFYYICRHILRNQYIYQYIVHVYHPQTELICFGHYYIGFYYSLCDFLLKLSIIQYLLYIHFILVLLFLLILSFLDNHFYYNNITDTTEEIFQKLVGYLYSIIHKKNA
jgi:hypothetical protein